MSTVRTNTITDAAGANSMPVADINQGRAKAWWNLNGTGVIALRDSFNVSSMVDGGVGVITTNFAAPLANANYIFDGTIGGPAGIGHPYVVNAYTKTVSAYQFGTVFVSTLTAGVTASDYDIVMSQAHGDT